MKTFWKTALMVTFTVLCSIAMAAVLRAEEPSKQAMDEDYEEETAYAYVVVAPPSHLS